MIVWLIVDCVYRTRGKSRGRLPRVWQCKVKGHMIHLHRQGEGIGDTSQRSVGATVNSTCIRNLFREAEKQRRLLNNVWSETDRMKKQLQLSANGTSFVWLMQAYTLTVHFLLAYWLLLYWRWRRSISLCMALVGAIAGIKGFINIGYGVLLVDKPAN